MEKEFIPYEQAIALKELGYNNGSFACVLGDGFNIFDTMVHYNTNPKFPEYYDVPLYQQAFRWFREKYGYDVSIVRRTVKAYKFEIQKLVYEGNDYFFNDFSFDSHQEAELECLKKLIELCKKV